jgi:hypothetical protein
MAHQPGLDDGAMAAVCKPAERRHHCAVPGAAVEMLFSIFVSQRPCIRVSVC